MRRHLIFLLLFILTGSVVRSQESRQAELYLLTCGPGTETYSVYGHSALRIVIPSSNTDIVYNWGVFDFATPNFVWKFAKGRLDYSLGAYSYERFLRDYLLEERWVVSQRLNLDSAAIASIFRLIEENLKPENISYRYDFYYDNCSTRIRDIIEKATGENLLYPPDEPGVRPPTFRSLSGAYEKNYPWTKFGIDLLLGAPTDKKASFREKMFLPIELKDGLSKSLFRTGGKMVPLLSDPSLVIDFPTPSKKTGIFTSPFFIFSLLLILAVLISAALRGKKGNAVFDIIIFTVFSLLSLVMIFFNFFTDHQQLRWNLNIIWLSPFVILCLVSLLFGMNRTGWFRIVFILASAFLLLLVVLPQHINNAAIPLIVILILRSSARAGYSWNPFALPYLTQL